MFFCWTNNEHYGDQIDEPTASAAALVYARRVRELGRLPSQVHVRSLRDSQQFDFNVSLKSEVFVTEVHPS